MNPHSIKTAGLFTDHWCYSQVSHQRIPNITTWYLHINHGLSNIGLKLIFWSCDGVCVAVLTRQIVGGSIWTVHCPSLASSRTISGELWHLGGDLSALSPNRPAGGSPPPQPYALHTLLWSRPDSTWYHVSTYLFNTCDVQSETGTVW